MQKLIAIAIAFCTFSAAHAQAPPTFAVASIRESNADIHARSHIISAATDGSFQAINVSLLSLVQYAYDLPQSQIVAAPPWLSSDRFDIEAKSEDAEDAHLKAMDSAAARAEKRLMLQALFADRFSLHAHRETRILPVYTLVVAKGGSKLQPAKGDGTRGDSARGRYTGLGVTTANMAEVFALATGRVVLDKTGLDGRYDVALKWQPEDSQVEDSNRPSLYALIVEQLGLKLEPGKAPVEVLVVDSVEKPSPN